MQRLTGLVVLLAIGCGPSSYTILLATPRSSTYACTSADDENASTCTSHSGSTPAADGPFVRLPEGCLPGDIQQIVLSNLDDAHPSATIWCTPTVEEADPDEAI